MPDYLITTVLNVYRTSSQIEGPDAITKERLVRAKNEAAALKHVVADTITVQRAKLDDAMRLAAAGVTLEVVPGDAP